jgi:hypothetical protein
MPEMPPPGRVPQLVEPTSSSLKWDAAVGRGCVPMRAPSVSSTGRSGAASLPGMPPVSISSSADRRRELLQERQEELQAQLKLVEEMLQQAKPSTMMTSMSGFSAVSRRSVASNHSRRGAASAAAAAAAGVTLPLSALGTLDIVEEGRPMYTASEYSRAAKGPPVPLMLDPKDASYAATSPFHSKAGAGLAIPGGTLTGVARS